MQNITVAESQITEASAPVDDPSQPVARRKFSMAILNFWLDLALLVNLLFVGWVSAVMRVVFPAPTSADGWMLWGMTFNRWSDMQFFGLCSLGLLVIEHLVLHWNWVCSLVATKILRAQKRPDEANQAVFGVGTFITVLMVMLGGLIAAMLNVHHPAQ
jgi:hypothetical protein